MRRGRVTTSRQLQRGSVQHVATGRARACEPPVAFDQKAAQRGAGEVGGEVLGDLRCRRRHHMKPLAPTRNPGSNGRSRFRYRGVLARPPGWPCTTKCSRLWRPNTVRAESSALDARSLCHLGFAMSRRKRKQALGRCVCPRDGSFKLRVQSHRGRQRLWNRQVVAVHDIRHCRSGDGLATLFQPILLPRVAASEVMAVI